MPAAAPSVTRRRTQKNSQVSFSSKFKADLKLAALRGERPPSRRGDEQRGRGMTCEQETSRECPIRGRHTFKEAVALTDLPGPRHFPRGKLVTICHNIGWAQAPFPKQYFTSVQFTALLSCHHILRVQNVKSSPTRARALKGTLKGTCRPRH